MKPSDREMRKISKKIPDLTEVESILKAGELCRLAMSIDNNPYLVTMNYGYHDGCLYFHSALEGLKIEIMKSNPNVCFQVETDVDLTPTENICDWSQDYRTVVGFGRVEFIQEKKEKIFALKCLLKQYVDRDHEIPDEKLEGVLLFKVVIEKMTGKQSG